MANNIEFPASVSQVRTLADGGIRVILDLPEDAIPQMAMLAECKRQGIYLLFRVDVFEEKQVENDRPTKRGYYKNK